nr:DUF4230 domain-containing protein [Saprospiraceae bacterium]
MVKLYIGIALVSISFFAGVYFTGKWYSMGFQKHSTESAWVLAEKISKVMKLVTVEGEFNEIYDYKDYYKWDWAPFRKKILLRVHATVSVGYDLEGMSFELDEESGTVFLDHPGNPRILSIDHKIDYFDIQQGAFNSFSEADYNRLGESAKNYIGVAATSNSNLFDEAQTQLVDIITAFEAGLETIGWKLVVREPEIQRESFTGPLPENSPFPLSNSYY